MLKRKSRLEYDEDANPWFDAIMTGLRTIFGLNLKSWNEKYGFDFETRYSKTLARYADSFQHKDGYLCVDCKGMEILDTILVDFLMEDEAAG